MSQHEHIAFGISGVTLEPGDHVCACFVDPQQHDDILVPYVRQALRDTHKCPVAVDEPDADRLRNAIRLEDYGRLEVQTAADAAV
jgi:hypothetical protein